MAGAVRGHALKLWPLRLDTPLAISCSQFLFSVQLMREILMRTAECESQGARVLVLEEELKTVS